MNDGLRSSPIEKNMSLARASLMVVMSTMFFVSGMFSIMAFAPIAAAKLIFSKFIGNLIALVSFIVVIALYAFSELAPYYVAGYAVVLIIAHTVSALLTRGFSVKWIFLSLSIFVIAVTAVVIAVLSGSIDGGYFAVIENWVDMLTKSFATTGEEQLVAMKEQLFDIAVFGVKQKFLMPALMIVFALFQLWVGLVFTVRFSRSWNNLSKESIRFDEFMRMKTPFWLCYVVFALIGIILYGVNFNQPGLNTFAVSALFVVFFFYFLQGFGIYLDLLKYLRLYGFMRLLFVFIGVVFMNRVLAIVGFFDLWINFRKFFTRKLKS